MATVGFESSDTTPEWRETLRTAIVEDDWPRFVELVGDKAALLKDIPVEKRTFWFEEGEKALHAAARRGRTNFVHRLVTDMGLPPNLTTVYNKLTPLHCAADAGESPLLSN